jgi:hypothetical protein
MSQDGRARFGLWLADHALALGGVALVALGARGFPAAPVLGWTALGLAFIAWVAEAEGFAVPRPGRVPIRPLGAWEVPLAFTVRRGRRVLLFTREENADDGGWSDTYTVRQQESATVRSPCWDLPLGRCSDWSLRGRAPVRALRFEHHERACYVERRSLERALDPTVPRALESAAP